ncbi:hypothetical protein D3C87_1669860 [compost metagenome]
MYREIIPGRHILLLFIQGGRNICMRFIKDDQYFMAADVFPLIILFSKMAIQVQLLLFFLNQEGQMRGYGNIII